MYLYHHTGLSEVVTTPEISQSTSNDGLFPAAHSFSNEFIEVKDLQHMDSQTSHELNWHPYVQLLVENSRVIFTM